MKCYLFNPVAQLVTTVIGAEVRRDIVETRSIALLEKNHEQSAVGVIPVSRSVLSVLYGIRWQVITECFCFLGLLQTSADVVALAIDGRIDLVGDAVVALILGESDIVSACSDPNL